MSNVLVQLMEDNLKQVWSERDPIRRMRAIGTIYAKDSVLYHVNEKTEGQEAISNSVTGTLKNMPEDFCFSRLKPVIINNNVGRLIWGVGPKDKPPVATGMDIAIFEDGKIKSLYVFLDS